MRIKIENITVVVDNQCDVISCLKDIANKWAKGKQVELVSLQADTNVRFKLTYCRDLTYAIEYLYLEDETIDKIIKEPVLEPIIEQVEKVEKQVHNRSKKGKNKA